MSNAPSLHSWPLDFHNDAGSTATLQFGRYPTPRGSNTLLHHFRGEANPIIYIVVRKTTKIKFSFTLLNNCIQRNRHIWLYLTAGNLVNFSIGNFRQSIKHIACFLRWRFGFIRLSKNMFHSDCETSSGTCANMAIIIRYLFNSDWWFCSRQCHNIG